MPAWMKIMRRRHLQMTVSGRLSWPAVQEEARSRNKEILMEVINSTNISDSEKQDAIDEMVSMTDAAEKELAAETLLSAQGFEDVVVSISDSGADVVVSSTQVSDAKRAQIEDIVKRKTGIEAANITIHRCRQQSEFFGEIYNSPEKFTKIVTAPDDRIKDRIYNSPRSQHKSSYDVYRTKLARYIVWIRTRNVYAPDNTPNQFVRSKSYELLFTCSGLS